MNLSSKLRFQENKTYTEKHCDYAASDLFRAAAEAALIQVVYDLPAPKDAAEAAAHWHRVEGAKDFVRYFMNVGVKSQGLPAALPQNLKPISK